VQVALPPAPYSLTVSGAAGVRVTGSHSLSPSIRSRINGGPALITKAPIRSPANTANPEIRRRRDGTMKNSV